MAFKLPPLPYSYDALEPYIDAQTMEIHYTKHHQAYVNNLNDALKNYPQLQKKTLEELIENIGALPADIQTAIKNNAGGHFNHSLFWTLMKKNGGDNQKGISPNLLKINSVHLRNYNKILMKQLKKFLVVAGHGLRLIKTDN